MGKIWFEKTKFLTCLKTGQCFKVQTLGSHELTKEERQTYHKEVRTARRTELGSWRRTQGRKKE